LGKPSQERSLSELLSSELANLTDLGYPLIVYSADLNEARRRGDYMNYGVRLYQAALKGQWEVARQILDAYPDSINAGITKHGDTILHIAAAATRTKFVEELVSKMSPDNLGTQNRMGNTALCLAAVSGDVSIAKAMVEANQGLPSIRGHSNFTPVQMAALLGHRDMVDYLLPLTTGFTNADLMALLTATVNTDLYGVYVGVSYSVFTNLNALHSLILFSHGKQM